MAEKTVVKKVTNAVLYSDGTIRIDNVRASYPHVGKPYAGESDDGSEKKTYGIVGMMLKSTHGEAKNLLRDELNKIIEAEKAKDPKLVIPAHLKCLRDGNEDTNDMYQDHFIIRATESKRPTARKRNGEVMTPDEADEAIYGGCYVNILIRPWYFNGKARNGKTYPKRILANFIAAQFVKDGEPFGEGRITDEGVFDEVEDDSSSSDDEGL